MFSEECLTRQGEWSCQKLTRVFTSDYRDMTWPFSISYLNLGLKIETATENEIKSERLVIPFSFNLLFVNRHTRSVLSHTLLGSHISLRRKVSIMIMMSCSDRYCGVSNKFFCCFYFVYAAVNPCNNCHPPNTCAQGVCLPSIGKR